MNPYYFYRILILIGLLATACGSRADAGRGAPTLRLGYFPNITHAAAIAGVERGIFAEALGGTARLQPTVLNAGPAAVEALFSGALDAAYIGPNPAINAFTRSKGDAIRIVAGATSGGAFLVVKPEIRSAADLEGRKVATPQLGNTQDVALRAWLASHGLKTDQQGGGDVSIVPQDNAQTLETFRSGALAGAWVPEPWPTRLVREAGGKVLVDERDLWPDGRYVTTQLVVRTAYLKQHPDIVTRLVRGHVAATDFVRTPQAVAVVNEGIAKLTGSPLADDVIAGAWASLTFTVDPIASSLHKSAADAQALGLLPDADLDGIYDLKILNAVSKAAGAPLVKVA